MYGEGGRHDGLVALVEACIGIGGVAGVVEGVAASSGRPSMRSHDEEEKEEEMSLGGQEIEDRCTRLKRMHAQQSTGRHQLDHQGVVACTTELVFSSTGQDSTWLQRRRVRIGG